MRNLISMDGYSGLTISMKITSSVLQKIESLKEFPNWECGGILGTSDGEIIDSIEFDRSSECDRFSYTPDIVYFNEVIAHWQSCGIMFRGFLHTHLFNISALSESDRMYIDTIVRAAPDWYDRLFFPVFVLPKGMLTAYCAERTADGARVIMCPVNVCD